MIQMDYLSRKRLSMRFNTFNLNGIQMKKLIIISFLALGFFTPICGQNIQGGSLIYAEPILPDTYDPLTTSDNETSLRLAELLFESLVFIDYRGEIQGRLAEKWKITNGNKRITFYLRKNVKWHDGTPFTAKDVLFTYNTILNPLSDIRPERRLALEIIKGAKVLSNSVIRFDFHKSIAEPERRFLFKIIPHHAFGGKTSLSKLSKFSKSPIGTGFYKFVRETKHHDVILKANTSHYLKQPNIEDI